jgi:hypothetical protein
MDDTTSDSGNFKALVLVMLNMHVLLVKLYSLKIICSHCACNCNSKELYSISLVILKCSSRDNTNIT